MIPLDSRILGWARTLWDYHRLGDDLQESDLILTLGSHDTRVAECAADLYLAGLAPRILFSGGLGNLTAGLWTRPEAELFAEIAVRKGVPQESILVENRSTNTGENMVFSRQVLHSSGLDPESFILVQKPYMERRAMATFVRHWPGKRVCVTSPPLSFEEYPNEEIPLERVIHILVGDLQRIHEYPERGFAIPQEIPHEVWVAYQGLVAAGFVEHLI